MRAWFYSSASGGLEHALKLNEMAPQPHQPLPKYDILIKVHATSLNPVDYKVPELGLLSRAIIPTPATPCMDFAGTVAATGDAIDTFRIGDRVFGKLAPGRMGALGEYMIAHHGGTATLPEGVGFEEASCVGTAGITAYQSIVPNVSKGDKVFINGGSGGCGTWGIQIAKTLGCHVTVSCSSRNVDLCSDLGADEVIDYTKENVSEVLKKKGLVFKLVVDNVGNSPADLYNAADHYLMPEGKFVAVGVSPTFSGVKTMVSRFLVPSLLGGGKRKLVPLFVRERREDMIEMAKWMQEGKIKAAINEVFEFGDAPKAFAKLKTGRARGKIVVRVANN